MDRPGPRKDSDKSEKEDVKAIRKQIGKRQRRGPKPMAEVISALMARRGYAQQLAHDQFAEIWRQTVGQPLAADSCTGPFNRGVLQITVRNSSVLQELNFQKKQFLKRLQRTAPDIRDLRFRVGALP